MTTLDIMLLEKHQFFMPSSVMIEMSCIDVQCACWSLTNLVAWFPLPLSGTVGYEENVRALYFYRETLQIEFRMYF